MQALAARLMPRGALDALRQLVLVAGSYYAYRLVRGLTDTQAGASFENARMLIEIERTVGLFFEPALHAWASGQEAIIVAANWAYLNTHFVVTTTFLIWLYVARNHAFYYVRNAFIVAMGIALVLYVVFPTAPPRFLGEWGFADTVAGMVGEARANGAELLYNPYAAVPSMHVAFALMVAVPARALVRRQWLRTAWAIYPALVTFVVIVTANHFWLDAALGAAVAAVSAWTAHAGLARAWPEAWAWRSPAPAEAPA
jgi:membrane-associated phospholipid phosphatase